MKELIKKLTLFLIIMFMGISLSCGSSGGGDSDIKDGNSTVEDGDSDPEDEPPLGSTEWEGVVICQIYPGGGNSGALFNRKYIVLHNHGDIEVNLSGWSIQYASASATGNPIWQVGVLPDFHRILAGGYYLVGLGSSGINGSQLPTLDSNISLNPAGSNGKIALVKSTVALNGSALSDSNLVDFVGYGTALEYFGNGPAPATNSTTALFRSCSGCCNNKDNSVDFSLGTPNPLNSFSPPHGY